jgi:hypothetical protein
MFAGVAAMAVCILLNALLAVVSKRLQSKLMKLKDERVKFMNEILSGMKVQVQPILNNKRA